MGALHTRAIAKQYGVPVILHTDHCQRSWLPWFDGLMDANEEYFEENGEPLFSSHMLDLSEEPLEENIAICKKYLERMAKVNVALEFELGVTGGEEDGVDNTDVDSSRLYTQPEEVWHAYEQLSQVPNGMFTCAASLQRARCLRPGQRRPAAGNSPQLAEVHLGEARRQGKEAYALCVPRGFGFFSRRHQVRHRGWSDQDEH